MCNLKKLSACLARPLDYSDISVQVVNHNTTSGNLRPNRSEVLSKRQPAECTISFLLIVPARTSHFCLQQHKRKLGESPLQNSGDFSNNLTNITGDKTELIIELTKTQKSAKNLKRLIEKKHLTKELVKECNQKPSLRGLPQIKSEKVSKEEWVEVLSDDYRRLAIANQFVLSTINDTNKYTHLLQELQNHLRECLCFLEKLSIHNSLELSHDITSAVVPRMYKNMTGQEKSDRRNCLIVRDVVGLVTDMKKVYAINKTRKTKQII